MMMMAKNMYVAFVTVVLAAVISVACGEEPITVINNISDFEEFCNNVNNENNDYSSMTVYLNAPLNFNGSTIEPVGNNTDNPFRGTFDGQGHTISNLIINTTSSYAGLFGHAQGATITNVTLGDSCSVTSTANDDKYIGGICGYCNKTCTISGCVNKANIACSGSNENYLGGIIAHCNTGENNNNICTLENNINYGSISYHGTQKSDDNKKSRLGGIAGKTEKNVLISGCMNFGAIYSNFSNQEGRVGGIVGVCDEDGCKILNSVNYGEISMHGKSNKFKVGGIAGDFGGNNSCIQRCYNFGTINNTCRCSDDSYIGGIAGEGEDSKITECISDGMIKNTESSSKLSIGTICAEKPSIISDCYYNESICNGLSGCTDLDKGNSYNESFYINGTNKTLSDIIRTSQNTFINTNGFTLTLNVNCENTTTISTKFIILPSTIQWYKDSNYSTPFNVTSLTKDTIIYGRIETYPETYDRFSSSSSSSSSSSATTFIPSISSSTTPIPPTDNATEYVKIVFNKKDLTETEVSEIITKIAGGNFTIEKMNTEDNNLVVIVKFESVEAARNFVEFIEETGDENIKKNIKSVAFVGINTISSLAPTSASIPKALVYFFASVIF